MGMSVDARGLACPAPVLMAKDVVEKDRPEVVEVIVDNDASRENVCRYLESQNFSTATTREGEKITIRGQRQGAEPPAAPAAESASGPEAGEELQKIMVLIGTDRMGYGDDELGKKLAISFIKTLKEMGPELWRLAFVNNGVKLTIEASPVLEDLQAYEKEGLTILVCGTCLTHFDLLDTKQVGETTNMLDIVTAMQLADKVVNV